VVINTKEDSSDMDEWWCRFWHCPNCCHAVARNFKYCYHCGKKIIWEGEEIDE
jgi:hypothetical protein